MSSAAISSPSSAETTPEPDISTPNSKSPTTVKPKSASKSNPPIPNDMPSIPSKAKSMRIILHSSISNSYSTMPTTIINPNQTFFRLHGGQSRSLLIAMLTIFTVRNYLSESIYKPKRTSRNTYRLKVGSQRKETSTRNS